MVEYWTVAVTKRDLDWVTTHFGVRLDEALRSTDAPYYFDGLAPLPLDTQEWRWLTAQTSFRSDCPEGLRFALDTAAPSDVTTIRHREWARSYTVTAVLPEYNPVHHLFPADQND